MTEDKKDEFKILANKLIEFLNNNCHAHTHIIITPISAEISEGVVAFENEEYSKD